MTIEITETDQYGGRETFVKEDILSRGFNVIQLILLKWNRLCITRFTLKWNRLCITRITVIMFKYRNVRWLSCEVRSPGITAKSQTVFLT